MTGNKDPNAQKKPKIVEPGEVVLGSPLQQDKNLESMVQQEATASRALEQQLKCLESVADEAIERFSTIVGNAYNIPKEKQRFFAYFTDLEYTGSGLKLLSYTIWGAVKCVELCANTFRAVTSKILGKPFYYVHWIASADEAFASYYSFGFKNKISIGDAKEACTRVFKTPEAQNAALAMLEIRKEESDDKELKISLMQFPESKNLKPKQYHIDKSTLFRTEPETPYFSIIKLPSARARTFFAGLLHHIETTQGNNFECLNRAGGYKFVDATKAINLPVSTQDAINYGTSIGLSANNVIPYIKMLNKGE